MHFYATIWFGYKVSNWNKTTNFKYDFLKHMNMKRTIYAIIVLFLISGVAFAQQRTITGTVTNTEGAPIGSVSVLAVGSAAGTTTDENGRYNLNVSGSVTAITFRSIGHVEQIIPLGTGNTINVILQTAQTEISEVVVTSAYGITSSARSTAYNAQVVSQEDLNTTRQTDINSALAGKVTGIQVRSQSAAALGRESAVRLRGTDGFGTGGGAIYVVDGTILPNTNDLNLDDIESVTVLQGPAAAALFGSQGANGAIVITLAKASRTPGFGVTLNLGAHFDKAAVIPDYQNTYAGGSSPSLLQYNYQAGHPEGWRALDGKYYTDMQDDSSWGPRMEGQEYIPWYAWYGGHSREFQTARLTPQPNNIIDFFELGKNFNNSITLQHRSDKLAFKTTYNNQYVNGLLPYSSLDKNNLNVAAAYDITEKLQLSTDINYINRVLNGEISDGYSSASSGLFGSWFHRHLDMDIMRDLQDLNHNGIYASFNKRNPNSYNSLGDDWYQANYWYNPYTHLANRDITNNNDRLYGNISLSYKIIDGLTIKGTFRKQQNTSYAETMTTTELARSGYQTGMFDNYDTRTTYSNRENLEFLVSYDRTFEDFSINANAGTDFFNSVYKANRAHTVQGLVVPNGFFISNSVQTPNIINDRTNEKYNAVFVMGTVGYKNFLFLNGTLRQDWFSTLPIDNNDVLSKSFGASFVFSDLIDGAPWLSHGKLRYSWGEIPQAINPYQYPGMAYGIGSNQWNGNILMPTPDRLVDPTITGAVSTQQELGLDLNFFRNRLGASVTYWDGTSSNFPFALSINGASGYTSLLTNIGEITKKGVEISLNGQPVATNNFNWHINFNYSNLIENDVVSLSEEYLVERTASVANVAFAALPQLYHEQGMRWGQLIGSGIKRNAEGIPILDASGQYQREDGVYHGSVLPTHTGGLQNTFTIMRDFNLAVNIDYSFGGRFASLSSMWGAYSGLTARTAAINDNGKNVRDPKDDGGGVKVEGVDESGAPMTAYVPAQTYFQNLYNRRTTDEHIYDLDFIKLREISFGYNLPVNKWNLGIQNAQLSVVARNLALLHSKTNGEFDPSEISELAGERAQLPGTRTWGLNLRVGF